MTYTKKTWASNEVITTTALNNIEGGVENAYKTSEMIGDGTLDMSNNDVSNIKNIDVSGNIQFDAFKVVKSDFVQYSDTNVSGDVHLSPSSYYTAYQTSAVLVRYDLPTGVGDGSTITVKCRITTTGGATGAYIRKNGVAVSGPHTGIDTDVSTDVSVDQGDYIDIYGIAGEGQSVVGWWPRICYRHAFDNWVPTGTPAP